MGSGWWATPLGSLVVLFHRPSSLEVQDQWKRSLHQARASLERDGYLLPVVSVEIGEPPLLAVLRIPYEYPLLESQWGQRSWMEVSGPVLDTLQGSPRVARALTVRVRLLCFCFYDATQRLATGDLLWGAE